MRVLLIDNYDSFTYNIVQLLEQSGLCSYDVVRNGELGHANIQEYDKVLLSPGPGLSSESGVLHDIILSFSRTKPFLGVCLGHQAIGEFFGATLVRLEKILHGEESELTILRSDTIFQDLPGKIKACRYHSWVLGRENFPDDLEIIAVDENGNIMAIQHKTLPLYGVQFHPESFMTEFGKNIVENWLRL